MNAEKKRVEAYMLSAARKAGVPIPSGEIPDEEPDFRFNDEIPALGIELSEVLRPASSNHGILPLEQESFHKEIITKAVTNAKQSVTDAEDRVQAKADATYTMFAADVKALREEVQQLKQYLDERILNAVDNRTIQVLRDYHLLDETYAPTHWKE